MAQGRPPNPALKEPEKEETNPEDLLESDGSLKDGVKVSMEDVAMLPDVDDSKPVTSPETRRGRRVDLGVLRQLGRIGCTTKEASMVLGFKANRVKADPQLVEVWRQGRQEGKMTLRRALYRNAVESNNVQAQMFLAKQDSWLGMSDRKEITGKDGGAIAISALANIAGELDELEKQEAIDAEYEQQTALPEPNVPDEEQGDEAGALENKFFGKVDE